MTTYAMTLLDIVVTLLIGITFGLLLGAVLMTPPHRRNRKGARKFGE